MSWARRLAGPAVSLLLLGGGRGPLGAEAQLLLRQRQEETVRTQFPRLKPRGLLTMRSLQVASTGLEGSRIYFGQKSEYSLGTDAGNNFVLQKTAGGVATPLLVLDSQDVLHIGAQRTQVKSLDIGAALTVHGVRQWRLIRAEDFAGGHSGPAALGWSRPQVSQCAGVVMLGGFCKFSRGEVNKTFKSLPPHSHLRVVATYHFIDRWIGEAGYLKLDIGQAGVPVVVWSEQHVQELSTNGISLCGQSSTPEGKFAVSIDIVVPHDQAAVQLSFGSTMDTADPCDESWGVSNVELYIRE